MCTKNNKHATVHTYHGENPCFHLQSSMWASKRSLSPEQHDAWMAPKASSSSSSSSSSSTEEEDVFVVARMMLGNSAFNSSGLIENWGTLKVNICKTVSPVKKSPQS